jgi:MATE family multidrug resistance protein
MLMGVVDTMMVGRVSVDALAAAAVANAVIWGVLLFGQGLIQGIDPIVAQAHGGGQSDRAALALQRGSLLALLVSIPLGAVWLFTEDILILLGQSPELARLAHRYTVIQIASLPCYLGFIALRHYLQGREIVRPAMWVTLVANVFNAVANYALIFGNLGMPELGLFGAGIATSLTRAVMLLLLVAVVILFRLHAGAWRPWGRASFSPSGLLHILRIGTPIAIQMAFEVWAFSAATLVAGSLGAIPVSAHTIALNLAALTFMVPLGVSQAAATRVGNLLGAGRASEAQHAAWVAIGLGAGFMSFSAVAFILLRNQLPLLYTPDPAVVAMCAGLLPIAGGFQLFDGLQAVGGGVLRGMGDTRPAALFNLLGHWLIGLPVGAWLALRSDWGLQGLWLGLGLGLAVVATALMLWVYYRGPARTTASFV